MLRCSSIFPLSVMATLNCIVLLLLYNVILNTLIKEINRGLRNPKYVLRFVEQKVFFGAHVILTLKKYLTINTRSVLRKVRGSNPVCLWFS